MKAAFRFFGLAIVFVMLAESAAAQIYTRESLQADAARLRNAVHRIYAIGIKPSLTPGEADAAGAFEFDFPLPEPDDPLMDFAATTDGRKLIMPLMSLKALEDLMTAYAWLYYQGFSLSAIDLYFTMLRYGSRTDIPQGRFPAILDALGVPADAYKTDKRVDDLSLRLRNEAFAFIIAHELGHIIFKHRPLTEITGTQAQADEVQSDDFALDIFARTGTSPLGPVLFFQAQIYNLLHPVEFGAMGPEERESALVQMTHPMSLDRIARMTDFIEGPLISVRPDEAALWRDIASRLRGVSRIMEDTELAACIIRIAREADLSALKPRRAAEAGDILSYCS